MTQICCSNGQCRFTQLTYYLQSNILPHRCLRDASSRKSSYATQIGLVHERNSNPQDCWLGQEQENKNLGEGNSYWGAWKSARRLRQVSRHLVSYSIFPKVSNFLLTWLSRIPLEKGREVAERYGVLELLLPILDFDPSNLNDNQIPTKDEVRSTLRAQSSQNNEQTPYLLASPALSPAMSMDSPASPYASSPSSTGYYSSLPMTRPSPQEDQPNHHPRKKQKTVQTVAPRPEPPQTTILQDPNRQRTFLMNLFLTEDTFEASDWLKEKIPRGLDLNIPIDDQGHTALHWAASLGRIKTLELLISGGADIRRTNASGETPLMRCVMMTNAYNVHCFPRILDNLYDSLMVTDNKKRSILHHISLTAGIPGRCSAAIHYLSSVVNATRDFEQAQTLYSMRDFNGDTAFDLAKKSGCKQIVDIFLRRDEDEKSLVSVVSFGTQKTWYLTAFERILGRTEKWRDFSELYR